VTLAIFIPGTPEEFMQTIIPMEITPK